MTLPEYENRVIIWIAEWTNRRPQDLRPDMLINGGWSFGWGGLGVDGADAVELLEHLHRCSGVAFDDFLFDRYFGPEGGFAWRRTEPLKIQQLVNYMWSQTVRDSNSVIYRS